MIEPKDLERLKRICRDASPGPWEADIDDPDGDPCFTGKWYTGSGVWSTYGDQTSEAQQAKNAIFCAESRTWFPHLIDEIERLQWALGQQTKKSGPRRGCGRR